jgi:aryl-alcohol dehydrogenase-like predicted oxidoreductase
MYRYCVKNGNVVSSQSTAAKAGAFVIEVTHLEENLGAVDIRLSDAEFLALDTGRNVDFLHA